MDTKSFAEFKGCIRKIKYPDAFKASAAMRKLRGRYPEQQLKLTIYECPYSEDKHFHVGHNQRLKAAESSGEVLPKYESRCVKCGGRVFMVYAHRHRCRRVESYPL